MIPTRPSQRADKPPPEKRRPACISPEFKTDKNKRKQQAKIVLFPQNKLTSRMQRRHFFYFFLLHFNIISLTSRARKRWKDRSWQIELRRARAATSVVCCARCRTSSILSARQLTKQKPALNPISNCQALRLAQWAMHKPLASERGAIIESPKSWTYSLFENCSWCISSIFRLHFSAERRRKGF